MSKNSENYYDVLEISKNATAKEIREVYISLCKDLHPDKLPSKSGSHLKKLAEERLKLINEAYQILNKIAQMN
jgi:molecular chaperone DnaJ